MAIRFAPEPLEPTHAAIASVAERPNRKGIGGRPKSEDPTVVLTIRVPQSIAERLNPGWRKRVADLLADDVE